MKLYIKTIDGIQHILPKNKIVVVKDNIIPWHDDDGIFYIGIEQFLLDENAMD